MFSICLRSGPRTLIPTGLRTPVVIISVRVWIGIHQMFGNPGIRSFASISSSRRSQVMPKRHCASGLSVTVISAMPVNAGSVAVCALPIFPKT